MWLVNKKTARMQIHNCHFNVEIHKQTNGEASNKFKEKHLSMPAEFKMIFSILMHDQIKSLYFCLVPLFEFDRPAFSCQSHLLVTDMSL